MAIGGRCKSVRGQTQSAFIDEVIAIVRVGWL